MIHALLFAAATVSLTPAQIDGVLQQAEKAFNAYVFPDVAERARAMLKANTSKYEALSDPETLAKTVTSDLYAVTHDKHVHVRYPTEPQDYVEDTSAAARAAAHTDELKLNFAFDGVRRLPGNVGYLNFRGFSDDAGARKTIDAAMAFLANTDALIIDLRHNGGGSPRAAEWLEGYFFSQRQEITSIEWRNPKTGKAEETKQFTVVPAHASLYVNKPIYVLTSTHTFSCAEQFTYDLHNLKRVTVVGETTGGGANPGGPHYLGEGFGIFIPEGRAYSPITHTNWEGTGIAPDIATSQEQALSKAYALTLDYVKAHDRNEDVQAEIKEAETNPNKALQLEP